jgi:hypothetical protein
MLRFLFSVSLFAAITIGHSSLQPVWGSSGTNGIDFLNIPVGGRPAALGGAYSALANDAYAPIANPAGLGYLEKSQFALMHVSYLESISYEFASLVHPVSAGRAIGASLQYLRPGDISSTDINGNPNGNYSGSFFATSLGYGQSIGPFVSLGVVGKLVQAKIAGISASGVVGDAGIMVRPRSDMGFSAVLANVGPKLTFQENGDSFPSSFRVGGFYLPSHLWTVALQGTRARTGANSAQAGVEWNAIEPLFLRIGYTTQQAKENSSSAGLTVGFGLNLAGQQLDYAWVPMGDLGSAQYVSMVFQWGEQKERAAEKTRPLKFKETKKKVNKDDEIRFQQEKTYPEIRGGGLHPR